MCGQQGSDDELEQLSPAARDLPLQRGMQTRSRAAALRQPTAAPAPTKKRRSSPAEESACPVQALDQTSPAKRREFRRAVEQPASTPTAAEKRKTTAPDQSAPAKRSRISEKDHVNGYVSLVKCPPFCCLSCHAINFACSCILLCSSLCVRNAQARVPRPGELF